jgi:hypothetical protein
MGFGNYERRQFQFFCVLYNNMLTVCPFLLHLCDFKIQKLPKVCIFWQVRALDVWMDMAKVIFHVVPPDGRFMWVVA